MPLTPDGKNVAAAMSVVGFVCIVVAVGLLTSGHWALLVGGFILAILGWASLLN